MGPDLATGPTLKTALCHIRTLVGRMINNGGRLSHKKLHTSRTTHTHTHTQAYIYVISGYIYIYICVCVCVCECVSVCVFIYV